MNTNNTSIGEKIIQEFNILKITLGVRKQINWDDNPMLTSK